MSDFTILSREKVLPGVSPLDIFKVGNTELAAVTDFSILLGARSEGKKDLGDSVAETSCWWTREVNWGRKGGKKAYVICPSGYCSMADVDATWVGARPALPYSSIKSVSLNERIRDFDGIKEIEYGEYPQTVVDEYYSLKLEDLYNYGNLKPTDKKYTTGKGSVHTEYEYNGSKYIRFVADLKYVGQFLSDGRKVHTGGVYWLRVEPIVWFVDEIADVALSKKVIFSGVEFQGYRCEVDFDKSSIKEFMDRFFSREIVPCMEHSRNELEVQSLRERGARAAGVRCYANHPYVYAYVTYRRYINSDIQHLYYWKEVSELLYMNKYQKLLPEMISKYIKDDDLARDFADFVNQKVISVEDVINYNYSTKDLKMNLSQKFATAAELSSADEAHFEVVRDFMRRIGIEPRVAFEYMWTNYGRRFEKTLKPNEVKAYYKEESIEQIQNYKIKTQKRKIREAATHPYVYAYIAYKKSIGYDISILVSCRNWWGSIANLLYKNKQRKILPEMLNGLLEDDLARDFIVFVNQQTISVEDVINNNYSSEDLEMSLSQKFATAAELSSVDDTHFEVVRNFVKQVCTEQTAIFEFMLINYGRRFEKAQKPKKIKAYHPEKSVEQIQNLDQKESGDKKYSYMVIHPYVYAYMVYKRYIGCDVLSGYLTRWKKVSELLYKTKQPERLPDMIRELIGYELARDFIPFISQQVISVEDVINHNYSDKYLKMDLSQKFATAAELCFVDAEHFELVRSFMKQVGVEMRNIFESWTELERNFITICRKEENKKSSQEKTRRRIKKN